MKNNYHQLTLEERYQIKAYLETGLRQTAIAAKLHRHRSTISRELGRNRGKRGYRVKQANALALKRRHESAKALVFSEAMQRLVDEKIQLNWSPEQITGYYRQSGVEMVSHERIYQYLLADKNGGGKLYKHLRHRHKRYKKRYGSVDTRGSIKDKVSIEKRPQVVAAKRRVGDWEGDTIIGKAHKGAIVTLVERKSYYTLLKQLPSKKAEYVTQAMIALLSPFKGKCYTTTVDNGKEFSGHRDVSSALDMTIYFAHPYCSWERGLNENTNGLIRQYFPKKMPLHNLSDKQIADVMHQLNHRPRKSLGFKTPHQVFFGC